MNVQMYFSDSVQKISRLDSQNKFQMSPATLLEDQGGNFARNISTNISTLGQRTHLKLEEVSSIVYNIAIS